MTYFLNSKFLILIFIFTINFSNIVFSQETNPFCTEKFWEKANHTKVNDFINQGHNMMERCNWTGLPAIFSAFILMKDVKIRKVLEKHSLDFTVVENKTAYAKGRNLLHAAAKGNVPENISFLVKEGVNINAREGTEENTPIHSACSRNNIKIIKALINNGAKLNALDKDGQSCLYKAVYWNANELIKFLLKNGGTFNLNNCEECSSLIHRYLSNSFHSAKIDLNILQMLIDYGYSPNEIQKSGKNNYKGRTALAALIDNKQDTQDKRPLIDVLLRNGVDINQRNYGYNSLINEEIKYGDTAIFGAIAPLDNRIDLDLITYLVFKGAKLNINGRFGSPLMSAVRSNNKYNKEVIKHLITLGADINFRSFEGETVLYTAIGMKKHDLIDYLINEGADLNIRDNNGDTVLHEAASSNDSSLLKKLLKHNNNFNAYNNMGWNILHIASSESENPEMISTIMNASNINIDVKTKNENGNTPLMLAVCCNDRLAVIKKLISLGANVNARNKLEATPLMHSSGFPPNYVNEKNKSPVHRVKLLLKNGANVNAIMKRNITSLHLFANFGDEISILTLIENGANGKIRDFNGDTPYNVISKRPYMKETKAYWKLKDLQY